MSGRDVGAMSLKGKSRKIIRKYKNTSWIEIKCHLNSKLWTQINEDAINKYLPFAVKTEWHLWIPTAEWNRCLQMFGPAILFFVLKSKSIQFLILNIFQHEESRLGCM